jgi:glycosyltransferase involved in cell wall biosynthesis
MRRIFVKYTMHAVLKSDFSLSIIVLAFNEEESISLVLDDLLNFIPKLLDRFEIIVVDDGSRDGTARIAREYAEKYKSIRVLSHAVNKGLPAAARIGYGAAVSDYAVWIEADGQFCVGDLTRFLKCLPEKDVVASYRERRRYSIRRRIVSWAYNALLHLFLELPVRDAGSAILIRRGLIDPALFLSTGVLINAELLLRAQQQGLKIGECPRTYVPRRTGESRIFGFWTILQAMADLFRLRRLFATSRAVLPSSPPLPI